MTISRSLSSLMFADIHVSARTQAAAVPRTAPRPGAAALVLRLDPPRDVRELVGLSRRER